MTAPAKAGRTRVERGIYRQPNGKYVVGARRDGVLRFCTAGCNLAADAARPRGADRSAGGEPRAGLAATAL